MNYVKVFFDWVEQTSELSCEEFGSLMRALVNYAAGENEPELIGSAKYLFPVFRVYVDREAEAYEKRVEQCSRAGKRSASERKRNAVEQTLTDANEINEEKENEKENEKEKEKEKEKEYEKEYLSYQEEEKEPKLDEIEKYILENNYKMDAGEFYDHYCAVGWTIGGTPIKDWRAAIRRWVRNKENRQKAEYKPREGSKKEPEKSASTFDTDDFFEAALRRSYED